MLLIARSPVRLDSYECTAARRGSGSLFSGEVTLSRYRAGARDPAFHFSAVVGGGDSPGVKRWEGCCERETASPAPPAGEGVPSCVTPRGCGARLACRFAFAVRRSTRHPP